MNSCTAQKTIKFETQLVRNGDTDRQYWYPFKTKYFILCKWQTIQTTVKVKISPSLAGVSGVNLSCVSVSLSRARDANLIMQVTQETNWRIKYRQGNTYIFCPPPHSRGGQRHVQSRVVMNFLHDKNSRNDKVFHLSRNCWEKSAFRATELCQCTLQFVLSKNFAKFTSCEIPQFGFRKMINPNFRNILELTLAAT